MGTSERTRGSYRDGGRRPVAHADHIRDPHPEHRPTVRIQAPDNVSETLGPFVGRQCPDGQLVRRRGPRPRRRVPQLGDVKGFDKRLPASVLR